MFFKKNEDTIENKIEIVLYLIDKKSKMH